MSWRAINGRGVEAFVERLALTAVITDARNHYAFDCGGSDIRRANLLLYLHEMAERRPRVMLVGEAPGYKGCRLTGVPFTSEEIVARGVPCGLFGTHKGYTAGGTQREQTASIVWEVLSRLDEVPLLWNAYPFHPFKGSDERTNRPPTLGEIKSASGFLLELSAIFGVERVIAVGNRAEVALRIAGIEGEKIRHPSRGGKRAFATGLAHVITGKCDLVRSAGTSTVPYAPENSYAIL
jgi:hypothetical protein